MAAVIALHVLQGYRTISSGVWCSPVPQYSLQPFKFGTIAFFLASGFLFGERIDHCKPSEYMFRRFRTVFLPWSMWFGLFCILKSLSHLFFRPDRSISLSNAISIWQDGLFQTAFWFVPNLLCAMMLLLLFRNILRRNSTGVLFLLGSLFYGVNIYGRWIAASHTRAVFGFVFYLWLGAWTASHRPEIEAWLDRVPALAMTGLVALTLALATAESWLLFVSGSGDPTNSLRISNQLYSVIAVLAIMKFDKALWPSWINVREHTFGLYLTHGVVLAAVRALAAPVIIKVGPLLGAVDSEMIFVPVLFFFTYGSCLLLVRGLLSVGHLRWSVGIQNHRRSSCTTATVQVTPAGLPA